MKEVGDDLEDLVPGLLLPLVHGRCLQEVCAGPEVRDQQLHGVHHVLQPHGGREQPGSVLLVQIQEQLHQCLGISKLLLLPRCLFILVKLL